jgi:DNA-directed RNA polymerase I subunit RPA2
LFNIRKKNCPLVEVEPWSLGLNMAATADGETNVQWTTSFDTVRREKLFRNPPRDKTAYPALQAAVQPHIESFNAILDRGGLLDLGLRDIGTKAFFDGADDAPNPKGNKLSYRIKECFVDTPRIPPANKFSTRNREIYPAECRERHATYRGKLRARIEFRVNDGEWKEAVRDLGQIPIMLKVNLSINIMMPSIQLLT